MASPFQIKVVKAPKWMFGGGIDLDPYVDTALGRIGQEIEKRKGRGLGARNNTLNRQRSSATLHRISTTTIWPRTTGRSWQRHQEGRFRGMAPRVVRKYIIEPLRREWSR